jgi:hypothetical protein
VQEWQESLGKLDANGKLKELMAISIKKLDDRFHVFKRRVKRSRPRRPFSINESLLECMVSFVCQSYERKSFQKTDFRNKSEVGCREKTI